VVFLLMVAEAARAGSRTLAGLRQAEAAGVALAAGQDKRSRLPAVLDHLLRQPAVTAPALARRLEITPQATLRLLGQLAAAGVVSEITGRRSFRAFGIVIG
jgi:predicted Rossmann fold nucleotide-binding protein DprA/Smf involved in DNA uptake